MLNPIHIPMPSTKARRQCANPSCGKLLSALNKKDLCFSCHDKHILRQAGAPNHRPSASRYIR